MIWLYGLLVFLSLGGWTWIVALWRHTLLHLDTLIDNWSSPLH